MAKLHGLDGPQRIEQTGLNGGPVKTQETQPDFSKFSQDELPIFEALHAKAAGDQD